MEKEELSQIILNGIYKMASFQILIRLTNSNTLRTIWMSLTYLSNEQMKIIDSMNINARTRYDSDNCEWDRL